MTMILEKCDKASIVCPKEMCTNTLGTNRKPVHESLIFLKQFPFPLYMKVGEIASFLEDNFYTF